MKKYGYVFINFILMLFMIVGLAIIVSTFPIKGNYKLYSVTSGSMKPAIPVGGLVVSRPANNYKIGDIVTYKPLNAKSKGDTVTHRIIKTDEHKGETWYTAKGDANSVADLKPVTKNQILGKQIFNVALLGYFFGYLRSLPGLFLIIVIPSIIIAYEEIKKVRKELSLIIKSRQRLALAREKK